MRYQAVDNFELRQPHVAIGKTKLWRYSAETDRLESFQAIELSDLKAKWLTTYRLFISGGPIPIDCRRERSNLFAVFVNHQTGTRLRTNRAELCILMQRFAESLAEWLGRVDFSLVLYRDDDNTGHALNTPIAVITFGRPPEAHFELIRAILSHEDVRRRGIDQLDIGSFLLESRGQGWHVEDAPALPAVAPVKMPEPASQTQRADLQTALLGYSGAASVLALALSSLAVWRDWSPGLFMLSGIAVVASLVLRALGNRPIPRSD